MDGGKDVMWRVGGWDVEGGENRRVGWGGRGRMRCRGWGE